MLDARVPSSLYRYRPLDDQVIERELIALRDSYLFASRFSMMNDPMEAFYQTGGAIDRVVDALLTPAGSSVSQIYKALSETIDRFALVSFSGAVEDLPLWAYYASNFAGMCLEFDADTLFVGDFQGEEIQPVRYARDALPPLSITDFLSGGSKEAIVERITRKRVEWAHEKEWRVITGQAGPKYYLDDALKRVFLGPRVKSEHAARVCDVLQHRPVEVLQGDVRGFELSFKSIKPPCAPSKCDRVGIGLFAPDSDLDAKPELERFLEVPFEELLEECRRTVARPNVDGLGGVYLSSSDAGLIYFWTQFRLRSGRVVYHKRYFDRKMNIVNKY